MMTVRRRLEAVEMRNGRVCLCVRDDEGAINPNRTALSIIEQQDPYPEPLFDIHLGRGGYKGSFGTTGQDYQTKQ